MFVVVVVVVGVVVVVVVVGGVSEDIDVVVVKNGLIDLFRFVLIIYI